MELIRKEIIENNQQYDAYLLRDAAKFRKPYENSGYHTVKAKEYEQ